MSVNDDNVRKCWFPFGVLSSLWKKSVYDSSPLMKMVRYNIKAETVRANGHSVIVGVVSLDTGEHRYVNESDPNFVDWVLASAAFPAFLLPLEIDGQLWSDGGIKSVTSLGEAIAQGTSDIDVVMCSSPVESSRWTSNFSSAVPGIAMRTIDLMSD